MEINRCSVAQGFMRTPEIVFDQPVGHVAIKLFNLMSVVSKFDELVLKRLIETLADGIVLGSPGAAPVVRQFQFVAGSFKIFVKFRSVISLDVFNVAIHQIKQAIQEVGGISGIGAFVHSSKSYLGEEIDTREDVAPESVTLDMDCV